jgi:hypothetical protein
LTTKKKVICEIIFLFKKITIGENSPQKNKNKNKILRGPPFLIKIVIRELK